MTSHIIKISLLSALFVLMGFFQTIRAQVEHPNTTSDTTYVIEEEVIYDTLYVYDSALLPKMMTKRELIDAILADKRVGNIEYHRGHYLISSGEQLFKLENEDLKSLLSPFDYDKYLHAQKNIRTAIPLFVISGCSLPIVGLGLAEFFSGWITMSKYNIAILANEETGLILTKNFTKGFFIAAAGLIIADAFLIPALALTIKSVNSHHRICSNFNENINFKKHQAMKLSLRGTPWGTSLTLTF